MIRSRVTRRGRTTIPAPVRKTLGLRPGDLVTWRIEDGRGVMTRAEAPADNPLATFSEWNGAADRAAYADW